MTEALQFTPNWSMTGKPDEIEMKFGRNFFKFKGPGIYLTKTDTILIICHTRNKENFWHQRWQENEMFDVAVYNCDYYKTIWCVINQMPARQDER